MNVVIGLGWDARPAAGWNTHAWQALLCHVFFDPTSLRRRTGDWASEVLLGNDYIVRLAERLRDGTAEPGSPEV